jgi:hypothetical protein
LQHSRLCLSCLSKLFQINLCKLIHKVNQAVLRCHSSLATFTVV